jgi:alkylation response protein AidB-like acyl-CoA dehydrogenase
MLSAAQDYDIGGMQLPYTVEAAANSFFAKASVSIGSSLLTKGNANLLMVHGTDLQAAGVRAQRIQRPLVSGTMCLSEPQAGSSCRTWPRAPCRMARALSRSAGPALPPQGQQDVDLLGRARADREHHPPGAGQDPRAGRQADPRARGISLFIVPKKLVDTDGQLTGERNDVALAGLNHKLGWRGTTNTLLNFGEGKFPVRPGGAGAVGYLVGKPGEGLRCMFHMMNEARIGVGMAAVMLGLAGYYASLDYAKNRPQGRPVGARAGKDPAQPQVRIIEHADVKRMLLAQKATAKAGWRWSCIARAWWTSSTRVTREPPTRPGCCWRC